MRRRSAASKTGFAIHMYTAKSDMVDSCFCNADGDLLIVPQLGALEIVTECGLMTVAPGEICVVQRGIRFSVGLTDGPSRGYVLEVFRGNFQLPDLGPIGASFCRASSGAPITCLQCIHLCILRAYACVMYVYICIYIGIYM